MGSLSIEIPDEECVKLFRYEDGDGIAAYLLVLPEHDMKAVKPRIDAQLDHEMAMSVNASDALSGGVVDRPPQRVGRVDVDGVRAGALDGSADGNDRTVPGRFHQILLKARSILSLIILLLTVRPARRKCGVTPILGEGRAVLLTPPGITHAKEVRDGCL